MLHRYFTINWIVGPRYDLFFFIGSFILTFLFYGLYKWLVYLGFAATGTSALVTYFIFTAFFDQPHIFQTFSRTHADKEEFQNRKYTYTIGLFLLILVGLVLTAKGYIKELVIFTAIFGSYHVIRQHYGFLRAYHRKNADNHPIDFYIDSTMFYSGMFAFFFGNFTKTDKPTLIYGELSVHFPGTPEIVSLILWKVFLASLIVFLLRQFHLISIGKKINLPKFLLLFAALSSHFFVFFATETTFLVAEALETSYHTVQYQGWIAQYQVKKFPEVKAVAYKWFFVAVAYGLLSAVIEVYELLSYTWAMYLFVPFAMIILFHYYIDGFIWRFGKDKPMRDLMLRK
ncbi:MAG: hypothetical protein H7A25_17515 [Leptospiraceae bacterium]|nr:hypothetical protein [Leptospiraceae bacterium]MCP5501705.1 hypothetical protein [Leptospiraceae bacterium]